MVSGLTVYFSFFPPSQYAAERLGFISERCILIGNCNKTVEAAHDAMMKVRIGCRWDVFKENLTRCLWRHPVMEGVRVEVRIDHVSKKVGVATMWSWPNLIGSVGVVEEDWIHNLPCFENMFTYQFLLSLID